MKSIDYLKKLTRHKYYVFRAGLKLKVPIWRLIIHDWQKFTRWEYSPYANYNFGGENSEKAEYDFAVAWLHHENLGAHHWGWWIPRSGKFANEPLPMQETYVREMVADWHGAERAYGGTWDISKWVNKNVSEFKMHDITRQFIYKILVELGYEFDGDDVLSYPELKL